jgi:hypothetical protein
MNIWTYHSAFFIKLICTNKKEGKRSYLSHSVGQPGRYYNWFQGEIQEKKLYGTEECWNAYVNRDNTGYSIGVREISWTFTI